MYAELDHYSTTVDRSHREVLRSGQERIYPDLTVGKRVRVACGEDPKQGVVVTTERLTYEEVPNGLLRKVLTLRGNHRVERWDVVENEVLKARQARRYTFSEGLGDFGILTVRVRR